MGNNLHAISESKAPLHALCGNNPQSVVRKSLLAFCSCLVVLTGLAWGISFICARFFHLGYPYNTPLFNSAYSFTDLTDFYDRFRHLSAGAEILTHGSPPFNYAPLAVYAYAFFILLFQDPVTALVSFDVASALAALLVLRVSLRRTAVDAKSINISLIITALCAYPLVFAIDRGNVECVGWLFTVIGLVFFIRKHYLGSALLFAVAVCVKPFPVLFFFLLAGQRRYKEILAGLVAACTISLAALKVLGPTIGIAYNSIAAGFRTYVSIYAVAFRPNEVGYDHSLFSCAKQLTRVWVAVHYSKYPDDRIIAGIMSSVYAIWQPMVVLVLIASGIYFWRKPVLNQLFAIVLLILLVPPVSYDYTLISLYLPWGVFMIFLLNDVARGRIDFSLRKCLWILIPCAILMTPQSFLTRPGGGFAGQVKAAVLTILFFVVARVRMPSTLFGELSPVETEDRELQPGGQPANVHEPGRSGLTLPDETARKAES